MSDAKENAMLKARADAAIESAAEEMLGLASKMRSNPELAFEEDQAARWITNVLSKAGYEIELNAAGLPTAFVATMRGCGPGPCLAFIAEYDALPGVGHGCGHNLIAAGTAGAALGVAAAMSELPGTLKVFGTPAEEFMDGKAGKLLMLDAGLFDDVDASLMFHPYSETIVPQSDLGYTVLDVFFTGRIAHAGVDPWNGLNALDGAVSTYHHISQMRQQLRPDARVHMIIKEGGDVVNVIPNHTTMQIMFRSPDREYLTSLYDRISACIEGAAQATGTTAEIQKLTTIYNTRFNPALYEVVRKNATAHGLELDTTPFKAWSTAYGNVTQASPGFYFLISTHEPGVNWHSEDVAQGTCTDKALQATIQGAKILATSAIDLLQRHELVAQARQQFEEIS